jgi:hypothetical protein
LRNEVVLRRSADGTSGRIPHPISSDEENVTEDVLPVEKRALVRPAAIARGAR